MAVDRVYNLLYTMFKSVALNPTLGDWFGGDSKQMANNHNIGTFVAAGVFLAILVIGTIAVAGIKIPSLTFPAFVSNKGRLTIQVTDKPVELRHLNLTIDKLSIHKEGDGNETWIDLPLIGGKPVYFDLLSLQNVSLTLSENQVPAGNYTMIKMHVLTANATYPDGTTVELNKVPSENMKIILQPHLIMQNGGAITILIDIQPDQHNIAISHSLNLRPVVKALVSG